MSESIRYGNDGSRLWLSPTIEVHNAEGEPMTLHYQNTRIRLFGEDWVHLNHVEYIDTSGQLCGLIVTPEFIDTLMDHDFGYAFDEYPDTKTQEWYIAAQYRRLLADLTDFEHGTQ